jgi:adenylosuccinate synthase
MALAKEIGAVVLTARESLDFINKWVSAPDSVIVIEGTQGYGLGLHAGHYPTCTSSDARAVDFLAMAGISPWSMGIEYLGIWLVARVYPIRVAGNSGPLKGETSWEKLGLPIEKTTVTHKVRRVGEWDPELIRDAAIANGAEILEGQTEFRRWQMGTEILVALTMADQKIPAIRGKVDYYDLTNNTTKELDDLLKEVQKDAGVPVAMVTTGPDTAIAL